MIWLALFKPTKCNVFWGTWSGECLIAVDWVQACWMALTDSVVVFVIRGRAWEVLILRMWLVGFYSSCAAGCMDVHMKGQLCWRFDNPCSGLEIQEPPWVGSRDVGLPALIVATLNTGGKLIIAGILAYWIQCDAWRNSNGNTHLY